MAFIDSHCAEPIVITAYARKSFIIVMVDADIDQLGQSARISWHLKTS